MYVLFKGINAALNGFPSNNVWRFSPRSPSFSQTDAMKCVAQASKNRSLADFEKVRAFLLTCSLECPGLLGTSRPVPPRLFSAG